MTELRLRYPSVEKNGTLSYGGSQLEAQGKNMQLCGCGVVACADVLRYLCRSHPEYRLTGFPGLNCEVVMQGEYQRLLDALSPRYLPLIPRFGINGLALVWGLNRVFSHCGSEVRAHWGVKRELIIQQLEDMLRRDIPVILSVGPNFPLLLGNKQVDFYTMTRDGQYKRAMSTRSHYVVVTGAYSEWLRISSWGRMYYIKIRDYLGYIEKCSSSIVSNIVVIK